MRVAEDANEIGKCGCGRSPTGKCIGWHGYSEDEYKHALNEYWEKNPPVDSEGGEI